MELPMIHRLHKTYFLTILFSLLHFKQALSQYHFFSHRCDNTVGNFTEDDDTYKTNLNLLFTELESQASNKFFNNYTVGKDIDKAYGLYLCRGDLNDQQCHDCVEHATLAITENCPVQKEAIVWYDECMVRYANRSIFKLKEDFPYYYRWSLANSSDPGQFAKIVGKTAISLIKQAAYNKSRQGYVTGEANITLFETTYFMAQCTPDILGSRCERCLRVALSRMAGCCGTSSLSLRMYLTSCMLRYDSAPFLMNTFALAPHSPVSPDSPEPPALLTPDSQPPPKEKSGATTLIPMRIDFAFWLLMMTVGIQNNIVAL